MKVLRIVPFLDFGGVEQRVYLTTKEVEKVSNFFLTTVVLNRKGRIADQMMLENHSVTCLNSRVKIPNPFLIWKLFKLFRRLAPDVVHSSGAEANFHGLIAAYLARVPNRIGEEIGFPNHDCKWRLVFKGVYAFATKVIAISQAVKNRIVDLGEVKAKKVEVVYNPVYLEVKGSIECKEFVQFTDLVRGQDAGEDKEKKDRSFVFVTTCRLVPIKNLDRLIQVFASLSKENIDRDVKLWIIGEGPEKENLEALTIDLGISDQVVFWGFQSNIAPFLEEADSFVLPSFSEGFSISLVEGMLAGLPCVATNQGGPSEILENGITGFLFDPKDSAQLYQLLKKVLVMPRDKREQIGGMAKIAASNYSPENYIIRLLEVYESQDAK